jgi:HAD superfamily hydrolase (TIGR01459 family)
MFLQQPIRATASPAIPEGTMSAPTESPGLVHSIKVIAQAFDLFLIDQFGVLHDGSAPFPGATDLLQWLRNQGKPVVLLTNSAKTAEANIARLAKLGVPSNLFDSMLTSGDLARRKIQAGRLPPPFRPGARVLVIGKGDDDYRLGTAGLHAVQPGEACDFVLFAGSSVPALSMEHYREQLASPAKSGIPGLCCNPDLIMLTPSGPQPGCGALANLYRQLGGDILWIGKPEVSFFEEALMLFKPMLPRRTLVIGDSLEHDIIGGRRAGLRTALVRTGVHQKLRYADLVKRMQTTGAIPDFVVRSLI